MFHFTIVSPWGIAMAKPLRIFVSSPGDVIPERRRAQLVIEELAKTYARFFEIEPVLWQVEPMLASGHFSGPDYASGRDGHRGADRVVAAGHNTSG
jgi:hypothetical protein